MIDGVHFKVGIHQVSESIELNDNFLFYVKHGKVEECDAPVTHTMPPDAKVRAEKLLARLEAKKAKPSEEAKPKNGKKGKKSEPNPEGVQSEG
jgi:hypothetical protein